MMRNFAQLSSILAGTTIASAIAIVQPYAAMALTGQEVNDIARSVTVAINSSRGEQGSGVIISKNDKTYYVLTANHVVATGEDAQGKIEYTIVAPDKKAYQLDFQTVKSFGAQGVDLAVFEFTSDENYQVATLANSDQVTEGVPVFVSGWLQPGAMSSRNQTIRQLTYGRVSTVLETPLQGYQIGYTNTTLDSISGGPVIDAGGRVVAIHGQTDVDDIGSSTGVNYGIPINTFLRLAPQAGLDMNLKVDNSPPPELGAPFVPSAQPDKRDQIDDLNGVLGRAERVMDTIDRVDNIRRRLPF